MSKRAMYRSKRRALVLGSDEVIDVLCDPCNDDDQRVQATGYCVDCNINMCVSCMKFHKKIPAVKDHVIKDKSTLSESQKSREMVNRSREERDPFIDRCPKHPEEFIKFYCNSHNTLCCSVCVSLDHRKCKRLVYTRDVSDDTVDSDELKQVHCDLQMFVANLTRIRRRSKKIKQAMNDSHSQTVYDIRNLKKKIIDKLDQLEHEILEHASLLNDKKVNELAEVISTCDRMIEETEDIIVEIGKKKSLNNTNQLFISMKHAQSRLCDFADEADQMQNTSNYERMFFQPDKQLSKLLNSLASLGEIALGSCTLDGIKYKTTVNVHSAVDKEDWAILQGTPLELTDDCIYSIRAHNYSPRLHIVGTNKGKVVGRDIIKSTPLF